MSSQCCPTDMPLLSSDPNYKSNCKCVKINNDFDLYIFNFKIKNNPVIIVGYDIMGVHSNVLQVCEKLSENGFLVVLPDFFRGKPWPLEKPVVYSELLEWIKSVGNFDIVNNDVNLTLDYLKNNGYSINSLGFTGFCWGGHHAFKFASDDRFKACATAHPSLLNTDDASAIKNPILVLLSKDEPEMNDIKDIVLSKPFKDRCTWERINDMHHGWCTARGNWKIDLQKQRAQEATHKFGLFFKKELTTN